MIAVELRPYIRLRPGESWTEENGRKWEAKVRYKINRLVDNSVLKSRAKSRAKQELARERDNRAQGNCTAPESRWEIEDMVNMKPCENEQEEFAKMKRWFENSTMKRRNMLTRVVMADQMERLTPGIFAKEHS